MAQTTKVIEQHLTANMNMTKKDIIVANFLGGLSWGLGTVVGAVVIVGILGGILNWVGLFDAFKQIPQVPIRR